MKKLFFLIICYSLVNNIYATDYFYLHYKNYTQNIIAQGQHGERTINVMANIGDTVTLYVSECCGWPNLEGPWFFNGDTITGSYLQDSLNIVVTLTGTYSIMSYNFLGNYQFYCPGSLGVQDNYQNVEFSITPNPFTEKIDVAFKDNELSEIFLYDIASRKLLQQKFTNTVSLNTSQLAKGIYIYEVSNKNGVIKKGKVVKD